jgi:hypothetical protein
MTGNLTAQFKKHSTCEYISILDALWMMTSVESWAQVDDAASIQFSLAARALVQALRTTDTPPKCARTEHVKSAIGEALICEAFYINGTVDVFEEIIELLEHSISASVRRQNGIEEDQTYINLIGGYFLRRAELVALLNEKDINHLFIDNTKENKCNPSLEQTAQATKEAKKAYKKRALIQAVTQYIKEGVNMESLLSNANKNGLSSCKLPNGRGWYLVDVLNFLAANDYLNEPTMKKFGESSIAKLLQEIKS